MRFRASLQHANTLYRIVQIVERLSKICILKFSPTHLRIICDKANEGGMQVWSLIQRDTLFEDYRIESNANDEITLKLSTDALAQALKSASSSSSPETIVKLAKKNDHAVLSFEIVIKTRQNKDLAVTQDVNIEVLRPQDVDKMKEPMCPEPDVHIFLPPLTKLRTVTEHLRQLSDVMGISANGNGHLKLFIETDTAKVDTEWSTCENPPLRELVVSSLLYLHHTYPFITNQAREPESEADDEPQDKNAFATTIISIKNFLKFLSCHVVSTTTIACICHKHCIIMYAYIGETSEAGDVLTFYIPAMGDGSDG